jgi:DNA (cytosine-5)-methyltransferase 1
MSEIEPFPRAVLTHHYPDAPLHGDFTTIQAGQYDAIDVLVGGTPCQSFSVAGLRGGMADERGNLALEYLRLAERLRPRWLVWENVPGVLSSNGGRDFGSFLGGLVQLGYGFAYRVLDAQYFGLAQRRKRVFVVGYSGGWRRAAAVLLEPTSLRGNPAPGRKTGEGVAPTISARPSGGGGLGTDFDCDGGLVAKCLNAHGGIGRIDAESETFVVANTIRTKEGHGCERDDGQDNLVVAFGWQNSSSQGDSVSKHYAPTLDKSKTPAVAIALRGREGGGSIEVGDDIGFALRASQGGGDKPHILTSSVRRLTPRECERLQGFPDDHTAVPYRGRPASDGPRYKALGNSMAVPVMAWIGRRIALQEAA